MKRDKVLLVKAARHRLQSAVLALCVKLDMAHATGRQMLRALLSVRAKREEAGRDTTLKALLRDSKKLLLS